MNLGRDAELDREVEKPPVLIYREGRNMKTVVELQTEIGWVDFSSSGLSPYVQALRLREMGIYMDLAVFDEESGRWEQVLFSEEVADMLVELNEEKQLPFAFEAGPSKGGLCVLWDRLSGNETERPPLKLRAYTTAATAEELDALANMDADRRTSVAAHEEG